MRAVDIIMKKRGSFVVDDNGARSMVGDTKLTEEEIKFIVDGYVAGQIPDYQISSWLMAVYFNGMDFEESAALTKLMLHSGDVIELHGDKYEAMGLHGPFVDKHSTGGVGDKISLPLAPIVAACGVQIPMMSGRALGHTGGTLDTLESIEGYKVGLTPDVFRDYISKDGYAMTGQTKEIVPADRLLYALRDVTGTVESVPLITASILSKKVAEGSDALVFDVKYGSGAFMKTPAAAMELANSLVKTAQAMGKKAAALITNMNTPLGCPADVMELTYALGAQMLVLGEKAAGKEDGIAKCKEAVASGAALKKFLDNVDRQGGDSKKLMEQIGKRRSAFKAELKADRDGFVNIDAYKTGLAGVYLGVGRDKTTDPVCPDAGMVLRARTGDKVKAGDVIMEVYGKDEACLEPAMQKLREAVSVQDAEPKKVPLIYKEIN